MYLIFSIVKEACLKSFIPVNIEREKLMYYCFQIWQWQYVSRVPISLWDPEIGSFLLFVCFIT